MSSFKTKKITKISKNFQHYENFKEKNVENFAIQKNENAEFSQPRKEKNPQKIIRILSGILLIIAVIAFGWVYAAQKIGNMQLSNNDEFKIFNPIISLIENQDNKDKKEEQKKWVKNILIAGIGGAWHDGANLTDSLMLANLNYDTKTVTLLSIPRDIYVAYSSNTAGKINALYQIGKNQNQGVNLLAKKVSEITGQSIHHFLIIDFNGFKSVVDALGGVEVDVPQRIYDREYPNSNWWYEIFSLEKWLQTLDGNTALKFARSRHSTSDFDRSHRQQLILRAIKDKALSLGIITNPNKISDLIESVRDNLSTDLTVGELVDIALNFKDINNENIVMYSYNDQCTGGACLPGSYLYTPLRDNFGWAWVLLPETATKSRLSRYAEMQKFSEIIFNYPHIQNSENAIRIITNSRNILQARTLRKNLEQLGFPIDHTNVIVQTGAKIENSSIHSFFDKENNSGFDENHLLIQALKTFDSSIPVTFAPNQEYATGTGQYIEIILGNDAKNYFKTNTVTRTTTQTTNQNKTTSSTKNTKTETETKTEAETFQAITLPSSNEKQTTLPSENANSLPSENSEKN